MRWNVKIFISYKRYHIETQFRWVEKSWFGQLGGFANCVFLISVKQFLIIWLQYGLKTHLILRPSKSSEILFTVSTLTLNEPFIRRSFIERHLGVQTCYRHGVCWVTVPCASGESPRRQHVSHHTHPSFNQLCFADGLYSNYHLAVTEVHYIDKNWNLCVHTVHCDSVSCMNCGHLRGKHLGFRASEKASLPLSF